MGEIPLLTEVRFGCATCGFCQFSCIILFYYYYFVIFILGVVVLIPTSTYSDLCGYWKDLNELWLYFIVGNKSINSVVFLNRELMSQKLIQVIEWTIYWGDRKNVTKTSVLFRESYWLRFICKLYICTPWMTGHNCSLIYFIISCWLVPKISGLKILRWQFDWNHCLSTKMALVATLLTLFLHSWIKILFSLFHF